MIHSTSFARTAPAAPASTATAPVRIVSEPPEALSTEAFMKSIYGVSEETTHVGDFAPSFSDAPDATSVMLENAERPSNLFFRMTGRSTWWWQYAIMDWYKSEVSVLSTVINRAVMELFRYGLELRPKFVKKCQECGYESQYLIDECPVCKSKHLLEPDASQKEYFKRPNGKSFLEEANDNGQTLIDVLKLYAMKQYQNNQAYTVCITGDLVDPTNGHLIRAYPLEFMEVDPKFVRFLYDETGKIGTTYAFRRDDRHTLINYESGDDDDERAVARARQDGMELYPACWVVGSSYGGTGRCNVYAREEVYQDHWFEPSLVYGRPIWFDIQDDLMTYHYLEKHFLKRYKFGYVRKMLILPGFNDDDSEKVTNGIRDVMAKNDNSIPIICLPPQVPGTAEMKAQVLELGAENAADALQVKNDIRDRICAHAGVPNLFAGDVEASGGMNNESQQITVFDRYLMNAYSMIDRQCDWVMGWFPKITDWELRIMRPSKAYTDTRRRLDRIQEAAEMKSLGIPIEMTKDGEFAYGFVPMDQEQMQEQMAMQKAMMQQQAQAQAQAAGGDRGMLPGDGEGPPERGSLRREDGEVDASKDEVDLSERESEDAAEI